VEPNAYFEKLKATPDPKSVETPYVLKTYKYLDFLKEDFGTFQWLFSRAGGEEEGGLIESNSLCVISGKEGSGKTFIAIEIALALAAGRSVFGASSPFRLSDKEKRKVIFLEEEMTSKSLKNRISLMPIEKDIDMHIAVDGGFKIDSDVHFLQLIEYVKREKINVMVFDSFAAMNNLQNENSVNEVQKVMRRLKLLREYGSVIFLHHNRKPAPGFDKSSVMRGSSDISAQVDIALSISEEPLEHCTVIEQEKNRNAPKIKPFKVRIEKCPDSLLRVNYVSDFDSFQSLKDTSYVKIPQWFLTEDMWLSKEELIARGETELKVKKGTIEDALRSLVSAKRLQVKKSPSSSFFSAGISTIGPLSSSCIFTNASSNMSCWSSLKRA